MNIEPKRILFIILCVFAACAAGCRQPAQEVVVKAVQEGRVEHYRPTEGARYTTALIPASQVNLVFKSPGLVDSIHQVRGADGRMRDVQAGDWVKRGTVLARVRPAEYEQNVSKARAGVKEARARLSQAQAALDEASLSYERAKALFESASLIKPTYDQAKAHYEATAALLAAAHAGVEAAEMTLRQTEIALEDTTLRAPMDGWVLARTIEKGSLAGNSGPGISLIDTQVVKAVFSVPDTALKKIRKGQPQEVVIETLSRPVKGVVSALSPQADPASRVFLVEVTIPNPHDEIRPGMIGKLSLPDDQKLPHYPVVPLGAVVRSPGKPDGYALFRLEEKGGRTYAKAQDVEIGTMHDNYLEVIKGAAVGDRIVAGGASMVRNGEEVRVVGRDNPVDHGAQRQ